MNIQTSLFDFSYIASWFDCLDDLSHMALPEPWCFVAPGKTGANLRTPILERYIKAIFHKQAIAHITADDYVKADQAFYVRNEFACFHTGLFTKRYDGIYMCFERNKRKNSMLDWYFKGWADKSSHLLKYVEPLPKRPVYSSILPTCDFFPEWEIRVNIDHILGDEENIKRLPESLRDAWNLPLLLETAVELGRRRALVTPSIVVPQVFQSCIQHLMPIYLTNPDHPDLAMALSTVDGYYYGHTCLTLQMAYLNARLLVRPTTAWLRDLVESERKQDA